MFLSSKCVTITTIIQILVIAHGTCSRVKRGSGPQTIKFSPMDIQRILTKHNQLRGSVFSSNMRWMSWDAELSDISEKYGLNCQFSHNQNGRHSEFKTSIGENLYVSTGAASDFDSSKAIQLWFDEKSDFIYSTRQCDPGKVCGHYTQIVWANTYKIGCSLTMCDYVSVFNQPNSHLFVCNYSPAGNVYSPQQNGPTVMEIPFLQGTACSQCRNSSDFCKQNLCANDYRDSESYEQNSSASDSCSGLVAAVVILTLLLVGLVAFIVYDKRFKGSNWKKNSKASSSKSSNNHKSESSHATAPHSSIVKFPLHGSNKTFDETNKNPSTTSLLHGKTEVRGNFSEARKVFTSESSATTSNRPPYNSAAKPGRPPPPPNAIISK